MTNKSSDMAKQLGSKGGKKTLKKYGTEHFRKLINKRWEKERAEKKLLKNEANLPIDKDTSGSI